ATTATAASATRTTTTTAGPAATTSAAWTSAAATRRRAAFGGARSCAIAWIIWHFSKLQAALTGAVGHRLHAAVVSVPRSIEHDAADACCLRALRDRLSDGRRAFLLFAIAHGKIGHREQRAVRHVVDDLRVDVLERAPDNQTRALRRAFDALAHAQLAAVQTLRARFRLVNRFHRLLASRLTGLPPDLLADVLDAFPLVRLRRTQAAELGRNLSDHFLVGPFDRDLRRLRRRELDALRRAIHHGMREAERELQTVGPRFRFVPYAD